MADRLDVWLEGVHAGTLSRARSGDVTFAYTRAYQDLRSAPPLSLSMPRHVTSHDAAVVMPWIDNLLPDNDDAGRKHADLVAASLSQVADSVRVVYLPGLPEKGDPSDWIEAGGTREALVAMCRDAAHDIDVTTDYFEWEGGR